MALVAGMRGAGHIGQVAECLPAGVGGRMGQYCRYRHAITAIGIR